MMRDDDMTMRNRARVLCVLAAGVLLAGLLVRTGPGRVAATTGPDTPTPARYRVPFRLAQPYRGEYRLETAARGARLTSGMMAIDLNELGYLYGVIQLRGYDVRGYVTSWVVTLYNFHPIAHGRMIIDVFAAGQTVLLGHLVVRRLGDGDLASQLNLGRKSYTITWRKMLSL
jgi:hypothetical protein